jgi:hypothetical protein
VKDLPDIVCCTVDYGSFISLADMMADHVRTSYYYSPFEQEFYGIDRSCIGHGLPKAVRLDEFMAPEVFDAIDLWLFPDIGYGGLQRYLRREGKLVWGSMGASDLELYRTTFLDVIKKLGLHVVNSVRIKGVSALADHLRGVKRKWVKINRFRDNMETWFHLDWEHSRYKLDKMAVDFFGLKEEIVFVVQDEITDDDGIPVMELGYDGHSVDGGYPTRSYQGYEKKNELYLGAWLDYSDLPEQVQTVNEAMAPVLRRYGYRNFIATELRIKGDETNFIDPTLRMPGQTGEHLLNTCTNLPEVILAGAAGDLIVPQFSHRFAAEATVHYTAGSDGAKVLRIPDEARPFFKGYHYCEADGLYHFPPHKTDEVGVIIGQGDTIEEAIDDLKAHFELIEDEPVSIEVEGFADLLKEIQEAEDEGVEFTDQPIPEPASVIEK